MNTHILFTDLDGTLLDDHKEITDGNREAIMEALSKGHKIAIATGRPLASARIQAERLGLNQDGCYAVTYNGGVIYDLYRQEMLYGVPMKRTLIESLFHEAMEWGLHIHTYNDTRILSPRETQELKDYSRTTLLPYIITDDPFSYIETDPYKMLIIDYNNQKLHEFQDTVLTRYEELDHFFSTEALIEVVPAGVNKGNAVRWLCNHLGIPLENSVAAGDAQNDISMLQAAHVGAVMSNAYPGIAQYGNYVTTADNNHSGVAEIIRKFILV